VWPEGLKKILNGLRNRKFAHPKSRGSMRTKKVKYYTHLQLFIIIKVSTRELALNDTLIVDETFLGVRRAKKLPIPDLEYKWKIPVLRHLNEVKRRSCVWEQKMKVIESQIKCNYKSSSTSRKNIVGTNWCYPLNCNLWLWRYFHWRNAESVCARRSSESRTFPILDRGYGLRIDFFPVQSRSSCPSL